MNISAAQVQSDMSAFSQAPPEEREKAEKEMAKRQKEAEARMKAAKKQAELLQPKQLEMAQKLVDLEKEEDSPEEKARLIRKIQAYLKKFKGRLENVTIPKTFSAKNSVEDLRGYIATIEAELGRKGGAEIAQRLYVEGLKAVESYTNHGQLVGMNLHNLGLVAEGQTLQRRLPSGEIITPPIGVLLEEFAIKYDDWFTSSVETRLLVATAEMVLAVHKMNSPEAQEGLRRAQETEASDDTKEKAEAL